MQPPGADTNWIQRMVQNYYRDFRDLYFFQTGTNIETVYGICKCSSVIVLLGNTVVSAVISGSFSKQNPLSKRNIVYWIQNGNDPPSDNSVRCWLRQLEKTDSVLHQKISEKMLIKYRMRFIQAHSYQLEQLLSGLGNKRLFEIFVYVDTKSRLCRF